MIHEVLFSEGAVPHPGLWKTPLSPWGERARERGYINQAYGPQPPDGSGMVACNIALHATRVVKAGSINMSKEES